MNDRGLEAGLRATFPSLAGFAPWVKGGVVFHDLVIEQSESDSSRGFEVGGGLSFPLGPRVAVTPGVTYTRYTAEDLQGEFEVDVSHLKVDVGLRIRM